MLSFPLSLHFKTVYFFLQVFTEQPLSDQEQQKPLSTDIAAGFTLWAAQMLSHCIFFLSKLGEKVQEIHHKSSLLLKKSLSQLCKCLQE